LAIQAEKKKNTCIIMVYRADLAALSNTTLLSSILTIDVLQSQKADKMAGSFEKWPNLIS